MSENLNRFLATIGGVCTAGGFLFVILTSALPDVQKYFAVNLFFLLVIFLYVEAFYQKKSGRKAVKGDTTTGR